MRSAPLFALGILLAACGASPATSSVEIKMRYSRFTPASLTVKTGQTVRFVVVNDDPIPHEFILGTDAVQQAHERAPDRIHDGPGEASVPAGATRTVEFLFARPGTILYGCHRPGHYAYGMRGTVEVR